jgi:hypothetical protein
MKHELKAFPINYFVDPEKFVKRYENRCIAFVGSTSPQEGAMGIVYQISPTLHVFARLFNWIEQEKVRSYLMLTVAFRNEADYIQFFDDNKDLRMTGDTEQRMAGFAGLKEDSPPIGFGV